MKRIAALLLSLIFCLFLFGCSSSQGTVDMDKVLEEIDSAKSEDFEICDEVTDYIMIEVLQFGKIVVKLLPDVAPITVDNFQKIVGLSLLDGTTFHRVYPDFMIQAGILRNGSWSKPIKGEFSENGVTNELLHVRGVISMARTKDKNSATTQFFIVQKDSPHLNGQYAGFGYVVAGMDVVDKITEVKLIKGMDDVPTQPLIDVVVKTVTFARPVSD